MNLYFNTSLSVFFRDDTLENIAWRLAGNGQRVGYHFEHDPFPPSYGSGLSPEFLLDRVKFGDGYEQVTESGARSHQKVFEVRWSKLKDAAALALNRFFTGEGPNSIYYRRPSEWFYWLPPASLKLPNALPIRVLCDKVVITPVTWNAVDVSATFTESFQP